MIRSALFVRLEAKPGKEQAVADFLTAGLEMTNREATTPIWFALKLSPTTFGVFDAFASEEDREAHLNGSMANALMARADEMLASPPSIEPIDVLAMKNQVALLVGASAAHQSFRWRPVSSNRGVRQRVASRFNPVHVDGVTRVDSLQTRCFVCCPCVFERVFCANA